MHPRPPRWGPSGRWWPRGSGRAGSRPRCPTAKRAAAPLAALAPRSQLFPPRAPDVSHYPNCNQPGSACFPDSGACLVLRGCSPSSRAGEGEGPAPLATARASPARVLTRPTDGNLAVDQLPKEQTGAGSQRARAEKGLLLLNSCCSVHSLRLWHTGKMGGGRSQLVLVPHR